MASNLTIRKCALNTDQLDGKESLARPVFWAVAAYLCEADLKILNARSETEPLDFLIKFQKLLIPFEVEENTLHVWHQEPTDHTPHDTSKSIDQAAKKVVLENSLQLQLIPLLLKLPFKVAITSVSPDIRTKVAAFVREAKRVGAKIKLTQDGTLQTQPSKIRAGRFLFTEDQDYNQALVLLALLAAGKSTLLNAPDPTPDWIQPFLA